ncbi:MAG TPA: Stp1/IreP family PP2C-type Ser/Thr phosphatase [Polyangiaceae bacterium]|jgi:protein phosphatase
MGGADVSQVDSTLSSASAPKPIRLRVFGRTDVGQIREHNEDNFLVADLTKHSRGLTESERVQLVGAQGTALGVCDGMGGAAAGEVASQLAVDIIYQRLSTGTVPKNRNELARRLVSAVEEAGSRIYHEARADRTRRGMGTTATIAALLDGCLFVAQVGDSRAYILRGGKLVQVSRDQSLVNQLIEAGQLTEEEAETFEHNNIILQALGTSEAVQVDLTYAELKRGDTLLLCSDGLSGMIRGDEIREVLNSVDDPLEACRILTERANQAGGHDNITVIVARFDGAGLPESLPGDEQLMYRKYPLPELPSPANEQPSGAVTSQHIAVAKPSEEAARESRKLKVGHTMVGIPSPVLPQQTAATAADAPAPSIEPSVEDEAMEIPTEGLPPAVVGFMVLGAMLVVAVTGFFLLR